MKFETLVSRRWKEALDRFGLDPAFIDFSWSFGNEYDHFKTKRGFADAVNEGKLPSGQPSVSLMFAPKTAEAPEHRQDGLVRHEIGHLIDYLVPKAKLNAFALRQGIELPKTAERRADMIAYMIWGKHIYYDKDEVQSVKHGTYPRPEHLGL